MKTAVFLVVALLQAAAARAQAPVVATGSDQLAWDQKADTLAIAQGYAYRIAIDSVVVPAQTAQCAGASSPFLCVTPFPAATPGQHSATVTAIDTSGGVPSESLPSTPLLFLMKLAPASPTNVRTLKKTGAGALP